MKNNKERYKICLNLLKNIETFKIPLRAYNVTGLKNIRMLLKENYLEVQDYKLNKTELPKVKEVN